MISCEVISFVSNRIRVRQYRNAKTNPSIPQIILYPIADIKAGFQEALQKIRSIANLYLNNIGQTDLDTWSIKSEYCRKTSFSTDNCFIVCILCRTSIANCKQEKECLFYQAWKQIPIQNLILPCLLFGE
jgi:hypothetical protein